jgi:hypothetical protein
MKFKLATMQTNKKKVMHDDRREDSNELPIRGGKIIDLRDCTVRMRTRDDRWTTELDVDYVSHTPLRNEIFAYLDAMCQKGVNEKGEDVLYNSENPLPGDPEKLRFLLRTLGTCLIRNVCTHLSIFHGKSNCLCVGFTFHIVKYFWNFSQAM